MGRPKRTGHGLTTAVQQGLDPKNATPFEGSKLNGIIWIVRKTASPTPLFPKLPSHLFLTSLTV